MASHYLYTTSKFSAVAISIDLGTVRRALLLMWLWLCRVKFVLSVCVVLSSPVKLCNIF